MAKEEKKLKFELTLGAKAPSTVQFALGNAEIKAFVYDDEDFETALDDAKSKLEEAVAAALIVAEEASKRR